MKQGTLIFIESKNPPVFKDSMDIVYSIPPKKGQAFIFSEAGRMNQCNLSTVQQVKRIENSLLIKTRNSTYVLYIRESE